MGGDALTEAAEATGAKERLEPEDVATGGLLAASHVHRYQFASELCGGGRILDLCCGTGYGARLLGHTAAAVHGVDVSAEAVGTAVERLTEGERDRVTFEAADALSYLRATPEGRFDAVVCFEGIEHVPDPEGVMRELARLTRGGAKVLVSLPNSRGFDEDNEFHVTDFGYDEMRAIVALLGEHAVLEQRLAEASVIVTEGGQPHELHGLLEPINEGVAWANHWIVGAGFDAGEIERASARVALTTRAHQNAYMRGLERANAELLRANRRMSRHWIGVHDAAAGVLVRKMEEAVEQKAALEQRVQEWKTIADGNDWERLRLQRILEQPRHRAVDRVREGLLSMPGGRVVRRLWQAASGR